MVNYAIVRKTVDDSHVALTCGAGPPLEPSAPALACRTKSPIFYRYSHIRTKR